MFWRTRAASFIQLSVMHTVGGGIGDGEGEGEGEGEGVGKRVGLTEVTGMKEKVGGRGGKEIEGEI